MWILDKTFNNAFSSINMHAVTIYVIAMKWSTDYKLTNRVFLRHGDNYNWKGHK